MLRRAGSENIFWKMGHLPKKYILDGDFESKENIVFDNCRAYFPYPDDLRFYGKFSMLHYS